MVCSDIHNGPAVCTKSRTTTPEEADERLSALPPSLRKHFLDSMQHNKDMLEELAQM
jgi:hypothetical protein